jgi:beta-lactam-binding protein with PASTA domain
MLHRKQSTPAFTEKDENKAGDAAARESAQIPPEDKDEYDIIMPDVNGMHILQAKRMLEEIGLRVETAAKRGKVRYQYPAPGTYLREESLCRLEVHK